MESTFAGSSKWRLLAPVLLAAQGVPKPAVARTSEGKPHLTGVRQGARTRRGTDCRTRFANRR